METILVNAVGKVRRATLAGRSYLVAPLTLIVPGVLKGSQGSLLYEPEDVRLSANAWNGVPLVVYHPKREGVYVSARDPAFRGSWVGYVFNSRYENDKLVAEGWFDEEDTRRVDPRVLSALEQERAIELSTGLFTTNIPAPQGAVYNSGIAKYEPYHFVAKNYRPDHLAILPDQVGACSIRHGCGVNVNKDSGAGTETTVSNHVEIDVNRQQTIEWLVANCECWKGDTETLSKFSDEKLALLKRNAEQSKQHAAVANAALQGFNDGQVGAKFDPHQGKFVVTNSVPTKTVADFSNEDLQKEVLRRLNPQQTGPQQTQANQQSQQTVPVTNMSPQDILKLLPADTQELIREGLGALKEEKNTLIQRLTANVAPERKTEVASSLMGKSIKDLREIASLLPAQQLSQPQDSVMHYFGLTGGPPPTANVYDDDKDNLPVIPAFTFGNS